MTDLWGFLLQTLTASGAAALLLVVKALFRDKLSPRWQFAAWGVLGLVLLVPAGLGGRYALVNWPWLVETAKTALTGDYSLTRMLVPIPLPRLRVPETAADWLYAVYAAGVLVLLIRYVLSYVRLRLALRHGAPAGEARTAQITAVAEHYGLPVCRAVEVPGLTSAFICGVFRPVLALPAGTEADDKVLLHELLHLRHRDAAWGLVANEKYARAPGTSSMANGGKNIRRRIESIARFKKYPAGMALVSVCVAVTLAAPLLLGIRADAVNEGGGSLTRNMDVSAAMASARTVWCTTPAGALDTYAKSVLDQNGIYRAMCAPLEEQAAIGEELRANTEAGVYPTWDTGLPCWPNTQSGYAVYNLEPVGGDAYEGLLVVELNYPPEGQAAEESHTWLAWQSLRTERQDGRWVVLPLGEFQTVETEGQNLMWGCGQLPAYVYHGSGGAFTVSVRHQTIFAVDNTVQDTGDMSWLFGASIRYDMTPKPHAEFDTVNVTQELSCRYFGGEADKAGIRQVGVSAAPMDSIPDRPELRSASYGYHGGSSSDGACWGSVELSGDWGNEISMGGGGYSGVFDEEKFDLPRYYAADLYINGSLAAELTLPLLKGEQPR